MQSQHDMTQAREAKGSAVICVTVDHKCYLKRVNMNCQVTKLVEVM